MVYSAPNAKKICFYWNVFNSNMNEFLYSQSNSIA